MIITFTLNIYDSVYLTLTFKSTSIGIIFSINYYASEMGSQILANPMILNHIVYCRG